MEHNVNAKSFHCTFKSCYTAVDNVIIELLEMLCYCLQLAVDNCSHIVLCQQNEKYIGREKKSKLQLEQHLLNINQTLDFS